MLPRAYVGLQLKGGAPCLYIRILPCVDVLSVNVLSLLSCQLDAPSVKAETGCPGVFVSSRFWLLLFLLSQFTNRWRVPFNIFRLSRCFPAVLIVRCIFAEKKKARIMGNTWVFTSAQQYCKECPHLPPLLGKCLLIFFDSGSKMHPPRMSLLASLGPFLPSCFALYYLLLPGNSLAYGAVVEGRYVFLLSFP